MEGNRLLWDDLNDEPGDGGALWSTRRFSFCLQGCLAACSFMADEAKNKIKMLMRKCFRACLERFALKGNIPL